MTLTVGNRVNACVCVFWGGWVTVAVHKVNQLSQGDLRGVIELFLSSTPQRALKHTHHLKCNLQPSFPEPSNLEIYTHVFPRAKMADLSFKPIMRNGLRL